MALLSYCREARGTARLRDQGHCGAVGSLHPMGLRFLACSSMFVLSWGLGGKAGRRGRAHTYTLDGH